MCKRADEREKHSSSAFFIAAKSIIIHKNINLLGVCAQWEFSIALSYTPKIVSTEKHKNLPKEPEYIE